MTHLRNIEWVPLTPEICLTASLRVEEYKISPFNAYHTAAALLKDHTIISSEHIYDKIKGIERIAPEALKDTLD